jgi:hypothetical protein
MSRDSERNRLIKLHKNGSPVWRTVKQAKKIYEEVDNGAKISEKTIRLLALCGAIPKMFIGESATRIKTDGAALVACSGSLPSRSDLDSVLQQLEKEKQARKNKKAKDSQKQKSDGVAAGEKHKPTMPTVTAVKQTDQPTTPITAASQQPSATHTLLGL